MRTDKKFFRFRVEDGQMSEVLALGALPLLLFSGTAVSGLVCGLGMFAVLLLTALLSSLLRRFLSGGGRVFVFAVLSAAFSVTLGLFLKNRLNIGLSGMVWGLPFVAVGALCTVRAQKIWAEVPLPKAIADAVGTGLRFCALILPVAVIREILALGTLFGWRILPENWSVSFFALPMGGLLLLGLVSALFRLPRREKQKEAERK